MKTNVVDLQNEIINNPDHITTILEKLNFENVKDRGKYIQFRNHGGDNDQGCSIYKDSLRYINFSHGISGNIFTLVEDEKKCNFPRALELISGWIGLHYDSDYSVSFPFNGFYRNIIKEQDEPELLLKEYDESILPSNKYLSEKFLKDGISLQVQEEFGIRFYHEEDAILIPIYWNNKLIGCKARANTERDYSHRWWAFLEYPKSLCLYGFDRNYKSIISKKTVVIVESEKSVCQAASFGCNIVLAIGGCNISIMQAKYIKSLLVDKIIIAFDEDRTEDQIKYECKKLMVNNKIYTNQVGYIYDKDKKYLGDKMSPTDQGRQTFEKLCKECTVWLGEENGN